jgi:transcriptional regulator with XRE-family HTH domain
MRSTVEKKRVVGSAFGALLRHYRQAAGLSQEGLAEQARMSSNGIGALERGDRQYPYRATVELLVKALNLRPAEAAEFEAVAVRPWQPRAGTDPLASGAEMAVASPRTSLVDRKTELAEIGGVLADNRLVTVTGSGGVGKTRTVRAVGVALVGAGKTSVWLRRAGGARARRACTNRCCARPRPWFHTLRTASM